MLLDERNVPRQCITTSDYIIIYLHGWEEHGDEEITEPVEETSQ